jgi:hypothetical protein
LVWINVTANPTAEWIVRQLTEAFPWDEAPHYLIRDRITGTVVARRDGRPYRGSGAPFFDTCRVIHMAFTRQIILRRHLDRAKTLEPILKIIVRAQKQLKLRSRI